MADRRQRLRDPARRLPHLNGGTNVPAAPIRLTGFQAIGPILTGPSARGIDDSDLILCASEHKACSNGQFKREDWKEYKYRNIMTKKFNGEPN